MVQVNQTWAFQMLFCDVATPLVAAWYLGWIAGMWLHLWCMLAIGAAGSLIGGRAA